MYVPRMDAPYTLSTDVLEGGYIDISVRGKRGLGLVKTCYRKSF